MRLSLWLKHTGATLYPIIFLVLNEIEPFILCSISPADNNIVDSLYFLLRIKSVHLILYWLESVSMEALS